MGHTAMCTEDGAEAPQYRSEGVLPAPGGFQNYSHVKVELLQHVLLEGSDFVTLDHSTPLIGLTLWLNGVAHTPVHGTTFILERDSAPLPAQVHVEFEYETPAL